MPFFIHEDGTIFSKVEFNKDLSSLLAHYPELNTENDKWTGHSFRSGISTILSTLGFSEEQIKSWGRWASDAYMAYTKDQSQRTKVRAQMTRTFHSMFKDM